MFPTALRLAGNVGFCAREKSREHASGGPGGFDGVGSRAIRSKAIADWPESVNSGRGGYGDERSGGSGGGNDVHGVASSGGSVKDA
ncbi:hypothetical protein L195_g060262, partial [Trifolium pratense]